MSRTSVLSRDAIKVDREAKLLEAKVLKAKKVVDELRVKYEQVLSRHSSERAELQKKLTQKCIKEGVSDFQTVDSELLRVRLENAELNRLLKRTPENVIKEFNFFRARIAFLETLNTRYAAQIEELQDINRAFVDGSDVKTQLSNQAMRLTQDCEQNRDAVS
jgi:chromosome segregation ATPase